MMKIFKGSFNASVQMELNNYKENIHRACNRKFDYMDFQDNFKLTN